MTIAMGVKHWAVLLPREHGAWAMFVAPVMVGIGAAKNVNPAVLLFTVTALGFFLVRYPLMLAVKSRAPKARLDALKWSALYGGFTGLAGLGLLALDPSPTLVALGALGFLSLVIYLWFASRRAEMSISGELIGISGLMLGAPGAYSVATGQMNETAVALYLLNLLYFGGTVFYVKFRVREQPRLAKPEDGLVKRLLVGRSTLAYHLLAVLFVIGMAAFSFAPAMAIVAFVPMLCKAIGGVVSVPAGKLNIRRMGFLELGLTVVFALFILAAFA